MFGRTDTGPSHCHANVVPCVRREWLRTRAPPRALSTHIGVSSASPGGLNRKNRQGGRLSPCRCSRMWSSYVYARGWIPEARRPPHTKAGEGLAQATWQKETSNIKTSSTRPTPYRPTDRPTAPWRAWSSWRTANRRRANAIACPHVRWTRCWRREDACAPARTTTWLTTPPRWLASLTPSAWRDAAP